MSRSPSTRLYVAVILVLLLALGAMTWKFIVAGTTGPVQDGRVTIVLSTAERNLVLGEMRGFVDALSAIADGLSRQDMKAVAAAARTMGMERAHDAPAALFGKLPLPFKTTAMDLHRGFDALAAEAESVGKPELTLKQLAGLLAQCSSCHARYAFSAADTP